jgi:MFS family permease
MHNPRYPNLRFNFTVNVLDGAFFGLAIGFASFGTILPLFVNQLTQSATLIGLIPAIHVAGLQFPPLFTVGLLSRQKRYKPWLMIMTTFERLPFLGLAAVAWFMKALHQDVALALIFLLLICQGTGGGLGLVAWQSMLAKVLPPSLRGTFFGVQAAAFNVLASVSAVVSGIWLDGYGPQTGFTLCFLACFAALIVSYVMLSLTREPDEGPQEENIPAQGAVQVSMSRILKRDTNFRWFLAMRMLAQLATMAFAFYIIYVVTGYRVSKTFAGLLTSVSMITQIIANPLMGWLGDRWSHRGVMGMGLAAAVISATVAWLAPSVGWFYLVVILAGVASVAVWTTAMAMTLEFGSQAERQAYIGLANTLIAPATILAPILGGWLADGGGYPTMFLASAMCGVITVLIFPFRLKDPRRVQSSIPDNRSRVTDLSTQTK